MDEPNFRNHLAFLNAHRGNARTSPQGIAFDGDAPFLSFFTPLGKLALLPTDCPAVWIYPWSRSEWPKRLASAGFAPAERLAYMRLTASEPKARKNGFAIEQVGSAAAADDFARVQARGFLTKESAHTEWWRDCFRRKARDNYRRPDQSFLLARVGGKPAAVLLTVRTRGATGIYAVATDPDHRCKGLSTALLARAIEETGSVEASAMVLQVIADSYAHGFYRNLGFEDEYTCQVWRRQ